MIAVSQSSHIVFLEVWKLPVPLRVYVFLLAKREMISVSRKSRLSAFRLGDGSKQSTGLRPQTEALWVHNVFFPLHPLALTHTLHSPFYLHLFLYF